ncbi:hypothetical protein A7A08_01708 [Methyloligella halotolerans]|uniref:Lambda phage tail tube protein N-terminal domain-containing protein n=1 Tax=Methyloligella halotolerans TaxID=1177755 RepID=A0A1E2RZL6_9HYPH|nr:phage tail tube protein [Methyloligella halotolerans]ODA67673.1 hypothetical protein A7A08_01708 [Methyloligella halotolerans]
MAESEALIGYGNLYEVSEDDGDTWFTVGETVDITPPEMSVGEEEVTHTQSPDSTREFIPTLIDPGSMSFGINWIPGNPTEVKIVGWKVQRKKLMHRVTYPNGVVWTWKGHFASFAPTAPNEGKLAADVSVRCSSMRVLTPAAAPANLILPAISGVAQVDNKLTAIEGIWTGAPTFAYQWKADDSDISGATEKTYTPVVGDVDAVLTVEITATNAVGSQASESAATPAVIAAA